MIVRSTDHRGIAQYARQLSRKVTFRAAEGRLSVAQVARWGWRPLERSGAKIGMASRNYGYGIRTPGSRITRSSCCPAEARDGRLRHQAISLCASRL